MLTAAKFQSHCLRLVDPATTPKARRDLVTEVRDSIELVHSQEYCAFLTNFLPAFRTVLSTLTKPQPIDNVVHQTRAVILEILNRLPHTDVLRSMFLDVFGIAMEILQTDNEDNAVTAIHIVFDLHKNYRHHLSSHVQPFLDFVRSLYESFGATVNALLLTKRPADPPGQPAMRRIPPSGRSFKVMTECPLLVMFEFQLYPVLIKSNIHHLLPPMLRAIECEVPPHAVSWSPKTVFQDFIAAQVKTVSFLAYLLKQFPDLMKSDEVSITRSVVNLLQLCPPESVAIRKELLVASRHILGSPFRHGFFGQVDLLLEPRILVGSGRGAADTLRPLAYSFLAELVHWVRCDLKIVQLEKVIFIFSTNLHDPSFSYTMQTSAVRLLLNLMEGIQKIFKEDSSKRKETSDLLFRILETMVAKYETLGAKVPDLLEAVEDLRKQPDPTLSRQRLCEVPIGDPMKEVSDFKTLLKTLTLGLKTVIWSAINIGQQSGLAKGSHSTAKADKSDGSGQSSPPSVVRTGLSEKECEIVSRLLDAGQSCFRLYKTKVGDDEGLKSKAPTCTPPEKQSAVNSASLTSDSAVPEFMFDDSPAQLVVASSQEQREMFDQFAQIFTVLDVRSFQDIFGMRMKQLFEYSVENPAALMISQLFLTASTISKYFADILLSFLVDKLSVFDVAIPRSRSAFSKEERAAQTLLKLFKIIFASVTLYPTNEPVLRLHVGVIVRRCLRFAAKARDPHNYLQMLRALFQTVTNNKTETHFELLYRDFMPLVEPLFTGLLALYQGPNRFAHSELIVELCLMVPARPSTIFPYLELQIKPMVWALQGGRKNVQYGLRTLEFWVDMLQPGYLESLLVRVDPELTRALYRLLRPPNAGQFGSMALRILGKLGSRARSSNVLKMPFDRKDLSRAGQELLIHWPDNSKLALETDSFLYICADALLGDGTSGSRQATMEHMSYAWELLYICLGPFLGITSTATFTDVDGAHRNESGGILTMETLAKSDGAQPTVSSEDLEHAPKDKKKAECRLVESILVSLVGSANTLGLNDDMGLNLSNGGIVRKPSEKIVDIVRFFALLTVHKSEKNSGARRRSSSHGATNTSVTTEGFLNDEIFLDAVTAVVCREERSISSSGLICLEEYVRGIFVCCTGPLSTTATASDTWHLPLRKDASSAEAVAQGKVFSTKRSIKKETEPKGTPSGSAVPAGPKPSSEDNIEMAAEPEELSLNADEMADNVETKTERTGDMEGVQKSSEGRKKDKQGNAEDEGVLATSLIGIVGRLCHCCYQRSWAAKWAGARGLGVVVRRIPESMYGSPRLAQLHIQMIRALLYVVRDSTEAGENEVVEHGRIILYKLLEVCFAGKKLDDLKPSSGASEVSQALRETAARLTIDLACDSANARETARQCLKVLTDIQGCELFDLLALMKEQLLRPLQQRSIRQHQFPVQIGFMEAIIFCLQLERPLLSAELFSAPLRTIVLSEVIAISEDPAIEKLTEAEEDIRHKLVENKVIQTAVVKHLVSVRRNAVSLLCNVAVQCPNRMQHPSNDDLFRRMISSFFKNLQSRDDHVVESSKRGLKQAISKDQRPKQLLQQNLRPILRNLADYKKLTIPYLHALGRVLELFSHRFNANLGEKLLEHLQRWTEPEKLAQLKRWTPGTEGRVGAAILDLFHLLPTTAFKFMEQIVHMVIRLEAVLAIAGPGVAHLGLKGTNVASASPYRAPLLKYCNQHAAVAARFFLLNLEDDVMRQLFFVMIRAEESEALREELMGNPRRLISPTYLSMEASGSKSLHIINLIDLLSKHDAKWLWQDRELITKLSAYWKAVSGAPDLSQQHYPSLGRVKEVKTIAEIFIRYCSYFPKDVNTLFELLPVFSRRTCCDFTFVKNFLKESVTKEEWRSSRRAVLIKFLALFQDEGTTQERKVHALQYIVIPMASFHLAERKKRIKTEVSAMRAVSPQNVVSVKLDASSDGNGDTRTEKRTDASDALHDKGHVPMSKDSSRKVGKLDSVKSGAQVTRASSTAISAASEATCKESLEPKDSTSHTTSDDVFDGPIIQKIMRELLDQPDEVLRDYDETLSAELLRLATLLIQYMPTELGRYRKELIKFGWNHLKREDSIAKQWAFVNVSRFFEAYHAPVKIILQVYVALLRACQGDGRELVQVALDILTPALPLRLVHKPTDHKYPIWIRYTKKILLEEGHSTPNLVHILQLIARHSELFYVARAQYVPIMVNSLSRIGLSATTPPENRRLALDLVDLIIKWENKRRANLEKDPEKESREASASRSQKRPRDDHGLNDAMSLDSAKDEGRLPSGSMNEEPPAKLRKSSNSQGVPVSPSPSQSTAHTAAREPEDFKPSNAMVEALVNFLVQIPFRPMDRREAPLVSRRCIVLLQEALCLWPDVTVRLSFVEKLMVIPASEKSGPLGPTGSKAGANLGAADVSPAESKPSAKQESLPAEKVELARTKRITSRNAHLTTALGVALVLIKCQGQSFVENNIDALKALIAPSITEGLLPSAVQFSLLLEKLIIVCPISYSSPPTASEDIDGRKQPAQSESVKRDIVTTASVVEAKSIESTEAEVSKSARRCELLLMQIYSSVHEAALSCLKSTEPVRNQCGLVVVKVFSQRAPREFRKYQELLAKTLHRMTKENLSSNQQSVSAAGGTPNAGGGSAPNNRASNSGDKHVSNSAAAGQKRGSTESIAIGNEQAPEGAKTGKSLESEDHADQRPTETRALILCVSLLGDNIMTLEAGQRKTLFHLLWALIDRCLQIEVLLEIVRVARTWVLWRPQKGKAPCSPKEPLTPKEKVHILNKMAVFERIQGKGATELMEAYLNIILKIFGGEERRPELLPKLERAFMLGMKAAKPSTRQKFFKIYHESVALSLPMRLSFVMAKQDWEYLGDTFWIKHAAELLLSASDGTRGLKSEKQSASFCGLRTPNMDTGTMSRISITGNVAPTEDLRCAGSRCVLDADLGRFAAFQASLTVEQVIRPLRALLHCDAELAYQVWIKLFPKAWSAVSNNDRCGLEKAIPALLSKEYHQVQASWPRNIVQALLYSITQCEPLPPVGADLIFHLGSRWNGWHSALSYLERRESDLRSRSKSSDMPLDVKAQDKVQAELEEIANAQAGLYRQLNERDYMAGAWKQRACSAQTAKALCFEQLGQYAYAQDVYSSTLAAQIASAEGASPFSPITENGNPTFRVVAGAPGKAEVCLWEERWIDCARKLCQWDVLTEFSRVVVNSELLHECLWRVPDWSALKELLIKNPIEDGPQLKLYQAYVQLQENKLELADTFIQQGYQRALERYCSLPESADLDSSESILVQFQQLVELQESGRILGELNALSRQGSGIINVEQKIDNVRHVLNTWRERLPSEHEPLDVWNDVLTWRNHVHAVVVNVLEALKEAASAKVAAAQSSTGVAPAPNRSRSTPFVAQTPQVQAAAAIAQALPQQVLVMGVNETAWNVHRFAKTCRKQGCPGMALYALQKLYPFGTMELSEYFVKTKETARSYMACPKGLEKSIEYGLHELNRCNMDHFNARQKAQLFAVRGKLCDSLGKENEAVDAFSVALSTSSDVGSAWVAWALYCDRHQQKLSREFTPQESTGNGNEKEARSGSREASFEASLLWKEAAANCYLQAIKFGSRSSRAYLSRVLRLLSDDIHFRTLYASGQKLSGNDRSKSLDTDAGAKISGAVESTLKGVDAEDSLKGKSAASSVGKESSTEVLSSRLSDEDSKANGGVAQVFSNVAADIPTWMWLPWIPQMLGMLTRKEAAIVRPLLVSIAQQYPQAMFFPVRAFMEERHSIDKPDKHLTKEALKMSRPVTPALLPPVSAPQASAVRQAQAAKENAQRAQQHIALIQKGMQRLDAAIAANQGSPDQAAQLAKRNQLKEELVKTHRAFERCVREYQSAQLKQKHLSEILSSGQGSGSARPVNLARPAEVALSSQSAATQTPRSSLPQTSAQRDRQGENAPASSVDDRIGTRKPGAHGAGSSDRSRSDANTSSKPPLSDTIANPFRHADFIMAQIVKSHQLLYVDIERIAFELSYRFKPQREEHLLSLMNALLHRCFQNPVSVGKEIAPSFRNALEEVSKMCFGTGAEAARDATGEHGPQSRLSDLKDAFEAELAPQTAKDFPTQVEPFIERLRRWQRIFQRRVEAMPEFMKLEDMSRLMTETKDSDVEVFGQYLDADGSEPLADTHVKIRRFSIDVRVIRRVSGTARGIDIIGSDGLKYNFALETSINSAVQASEDRIAQIYRLLNAEIFAKDAEAQRRRIWLTVPTFVATGARTRLVSDDVQYSSLAEGLEHHLDYEHKPFDEPLVAFRTLASEAYARRRSGTTEQSSRAESIAARVEAYHTVCQSHVPDTCLAEWVRSRMPTSTSNFVFRKRFSETLAVASLLSYCLAIGSRRPQNMLMSWSTGSIYNAHMRGLVSNRGVLECDEAVPFRLTRNLCRVLGPFGLDGPYFGCMAAALQALLRKEDRLRLFLNTVLRDELVTWTASRGEASRAKASAAVTGRSPETSGSDCALVDNRLMLSVEAVMARLKLRAETSSVDEDDNDTKMEDASADERHERVLETTRLLIERAREPRNLAQMDASWLAWY